MKILVTKASMFSRNRDYRNSAALYHMLPAKSIDGTTMGVSAFDALVCPVKRREKKKGGSRKNVSEIRCKGSSEDSGDITEPRKGLRSPAQMEWKET